MRGILLPYGQQAIAHGPLNLQVAGARQHREKSLGVGAV